MPRRVRRPFQRERLRSDAAFALEVSFCNEHGIPHSEFLAWKPEDRAKALAFVMESSEHCSMCGTAAWEWEENPHAYDAEEKQCKGCYLKGVYSDSSDTRIKGATVVLVKNTPMRRAKLQVAIAKKRKMKREAAEEAARVIEESARVG